jgi:hypothetical protein
MKGASMKYARSLVLASVAALVLAGAASASTSVQQTSITKQIHGVPCSVTAYGSFTTVNGRFTMTYGGGVSCAGGIGEKTIDVLPQVFNNVNGKPLWFDISLVGQYQGPTPITPLRLSASAPAVASHQYRLLVYGQVTLANGKTFSATVCSACVNSPMLTIRGVDTFAPETPTTVQLRGIPCSVIESGPVFNIVNGSYVMSYSGYTNCAGLANTGQQQSLTICAQVGHRINGKDVWFTIAGSCLSEGPTLTNALGVVTARTAYLGHGYRIKAAATIKYPTAGGAAKRSATAYGGSAAP